MSSCGDPRLLDDEPITLIGWFLGVRRLLVPGKACDSVLQLSNARYVIH